MQSEVQKTKVPPTSDEYVLDELCICEEKLLKLMEELEASGNDVQLLTQQMEAEEVSKTAYLSSTYFTAADVAEPTLTLRSTCL